LNGDLGIGWEYRSDSAKTAWKIRSWAIEKNGIAPWKVDVACGSLNKGCKAIRPTAADWGERGQFACGSRDCVAARRRAGIKKIDRKDFDGFNVSTTSTNRVRRSLEWLRKVDIALSEK
jgi:hypothetical protein